MAEAFWGWREEYSLLQGTGGRKYWGWKPEWTIWDAEAPAGKRTDPVRMYEYNLSSDFRFYASRLVALGADADDIVRITRVSDGTSEYECVLAKKGTPLHEQWLTYCTQTARSGGRTRPRRYGYA
jgi:hypothetical protein